MTARLLNDRSVLPSVIAASFSTSTISFSSLNAINLSTGTISTVSLWTDGIISSTTMGVNVNSEELHCIE